MAAVEKRFPKNGVSNENNSFESTLNKESYIHARIIGTDYTYKHKIVWKNAVGFLVIHLLALWGFWKFVTGHVTLYTTIWTMAIFFLSSQGVLMGAHRLFTHKSYSATPLLRAVLILLQTVAGQNSMYIWCRDHRLHHRYSDTDADPHNAKRGFFFSHIGWLMSRKHPYVIQLGKRIDMSDLEADWMVTFQKKHYYILYIIFGIFIPVWVPIHYFGENFVDSALVCYIFRSILLLNFTWSVNSAAHLYGTRPYEKNIQPVESWFVSLISCGEGWHNYHHTFPWDYNAAELSMPFNPTATIIRLCEKLGLAYDLKTVSPEMIGKRICRTGDGTHYALGNYEARVAVTAIGPLHPLNPTYTTKFDPPKAILEDQGLPLFHEADVIKETTVNNTRQYTTA